MSFLTIERMSTLSIENGNRFWRDEVGKLHRVDGPAIEHANGDKEWMVSGRLHRLDGPAREWINGEREWFVNGKLHRINGPAIEMANGDKQWWFHGKQYTETQFNSIVGQERL